MSDYKFQTPDTLFECDDCGAKHKGQDLHPVQWAVGSTGNVCASCLADYGPLETSSDGMASAHWPK